MGVFSRLRAMVTRSTTSARPAEWLLDWLFDGQKSSAGVVVSQMRALQEVTCMACVSIRSADLAKLPVHVWRTRADGGQEIVPDHPLERILTRPNAWQTRMEFVETMQAALLMKGNAFAAIDRNGRSTPLGLIPISDAVLVSNDDGDLFYRWTAGNEYEKAALSRFKNPIPAADVLHLRWLSLNGLLGLSRMSLARDAIGLSLALEEHSARLFANGARPGGVLATEKRLDDATFARFKAQWDAYSGSGNSGKTPILEEGMKWLPQAMTSVESQTIDARRLQTEQIATVFDVPLHRLGIIPEGGGPAIIQAHQMYLNNTLSTDAERWEAKLGAAFGLPEGMFVEFDLDYFNRADVQTRMTAYRTGVVGMILTPDEARNKEGLGRVTGGDTLYQPTNVAPIGFMPNGSETGPGSDITGAPAPGGDGDPAAVGPVE
jgi:HK97 family phage portal protein